MFACTSMFVGFSFPLRSAMASGFPEMFHAPGISYFLGSPSYCWFHSRSFMQIPRRVIPAEILIFCTWPISVGRPLKSVWKLPWLSTFLHIACWQNQRSAASWSRSWPGTMEEAASECLARGGSGHGEASTEERSWVPHRGSFQMKTF